MENRKNPHTWTLIVIILGTISFCCIGSIFIPSITSDFSIDQLMRFFAILFLISSIALVFLLLIDRRIYNKNLDILEKEYKEKLKILEINYQRKLEDETEKILQDTTPIFLEKWFSEISKAEYHSEREVETKFIYPLIRFLGYEFNDIHMQHSMKVPIGRQNVFAVADFVIDNPNTSEPLIVVEAKSTSQLLDLDVQNQARSYAFTIKAPYYLITNGVSLSLFKRDLSQDIQLLNTDIRTLKQNWGKLYGFIGNKVRSSKTLILENEGLVD